MAVLHGSRLPADIQTTKLNLDAAVAQAALCSGVRGHEAAQPTRVDLDGVVDQGDLVADVVAHRQGPGKGQALSWSLILLATQSISGAGSGILLGVLLGLLINTKLTGVLVFAYVLIYGVIEWRRHGMAAVSVDLQCRLAALIIGTAMWLPMIIRNIHVYGSPTAESVANVPRAWASTWQAVIETFQYMARTFWASSGPSNNVSHGFPLAGILLTVLAAWGGLMRVRAHYLHKVPQGPKLVSPSAFYAMAGVFALNWVLVVRFGISYGQGQGRFFFPLLPVVAVLLGVGLAQTSLGCRVLNARYGLLAGFFVYAAVFAVFSVATSIRLVATVH